MNILIRHAKADELKQLAEIELAAATLFPADRIPQPSQSLPFNVLQHAQKNHLLFVAEQNSKLLGFASCHLYESHLHLDEISVLPESGKQGIGRALVERVLDAARQNHCKACSLITFEDFAWNAPFYQKLGFEVLAKNKVPYHLELMLWEEKNLGLIHRVAMLKKII